MPRSIKNKKEVILKAAIHEFARHGFSRAKTAAIAAEAGVAEGTIYNYFKNKDDLIITIFEQTWREWIRKVRRALTPVDGPLEKLTVVLTTVMDLFQSDPALAEVFVVEFRQSGKCFSITPVSVILEFLDLLEDILKEGIARGVIRPDINTKIARGLLFGAVENIVLGWVLRRTHPDYFKGEKPYTLAEARENLMKLIGAGLVAGRPEP